MEMLRHQTRRIEGSLTDEEKKQDTLMSQDYVQVLDQVSSLGQQHLGPAIAFFLSLNARGFRSSCRHC